MSAIDEAASSVGDRAASDMRYVTEVLRGHIDVMR